MNRKILVCVVILSLCSCNLNKHKHTPLSWQKVQNGVFTGNMIIVTEKDTFCLARKGAKYIGRFGVEYTGQYFVGRNLDRISYSCNIENGVLVGDYIRYYGYYRGDSSQVLSQGHLVNGLWAGYNIRYYSNGVVKEIEIYNPCGGYMKVVIWMYFDESGELLKIEDYGAIPNSCLIPNQYLFDTLPEKYRYHYDTLRANNALQITR